MKILDDMRDYLLNLDYLDYLYTSSLGTVLHCNYRSIISYDKQKIANNHGLGIIDSDHERGTYRLHLLRSDYAYPYQVVELHHKYAFAHEKAFVYSSREVRLILNKLNLQSREKPSTI